MSVYPLREHSTRLLLKMILPSMILPIPFLTNPERSGDRQAKLARRVIKANRLTEFEK